MPCRTIPWDADDGSLMHFKKCGDFLGTDHKKCDLVDW